MPHCTEVCCLCTYISVIFVLSYSARCVIFEYVNKYFRILLSMLNVAIVVDLLMLYFFQQAPSRTLPPPTTRPKMFTRITPLAVTMLLTATWMSTVIFPLWYLRGDWMSCNMWVKYTFVISGVVFCGFILFYRLGFSRFLGCFASLCQFSYELH